MLGISIYICFLTATILTFWRKKWYLIDHSSLLSQGVFWGALAVPIISFFYFGNYAWQGYSPSLDARGLKEFISISTLPLGLLSLSIPLVAITASVHRSIQTQEQISSALRQVSIAQKKNSLDEYYVREKNFLDKCSFVEKRVGSVRTLMIDGPIENDISLSAPHKLFNTIYANSHPDKISLYEASESIFQKISVEAMTIDENIKLHMELTETRNASDIDGDAIRLFVITRAICKTFDILHVDLFPVPYFMIKSSKEMIQVCVACEADLKQWLRKYIILIESFSGSVWPEQKIYLFNIRRYLFIGANFFRCFESGSIIQKYDSLNWEGTTSVFKN